MDISANETREREKKNVYCDCERWQLGIPTKWIQRQKYFGLIPSQFLTFIWFYVVVLVVKSKFSQSSHKYLIYNFIFSCVYSKVILKK